MDPIQRTVFCKADDCPSLRGGQGIHVKATGVQKRFQSRKTCWSSEYSDGDHAKIRHPAGRTKESAPTSTLELWNARQRQGLLPPWLALGQDHREEHDVHANPEAPRQELTWFLRPSPTIWSRWLIVPQVAYAWDLHLIERELNTMISRDSIDSSPRDRVRVEMVQAPPSLCLRLFSSREAAQRYKVLMASPTVANVFFISSLLLSNLVLLGVSIGQFAGGLAVVLLSVLSLGCCIASHMLFGRQSVEDSVGVAWALKTWIPTGIPPSFSRKEALQEIGKGGHTSRAKQSKLQKREEGWYQFVGSEESDWLAAHGFEIEKTVRKRRKSIWGRLFR